MGVLSPHPSRSTLENANIPLPSYNIGVLSSILVHPGWVSAHDDPTPSQKGIVTGVYYVGTWLGYVFVSRPLSDSLGRRYAAMAGTAVLCVGAGMQARSRALAAMILGRAVCGLGVAVISTSVPLYQRFVRIARGAGYVLTGTVRSPRPRIEAASSR